MIRSHGVGRDVYEQIAEKGNPMLDATCPFVARIHKIVSEKAAEGYFILIAGDASHPEVQGIVGHCGENCMVFKDKTELQDFFEKKYTNLQKGVAIVAQTTYNIVVWDECLKIIPKDDPDIVIFDTICNATEARQSDAEKLSREADLMIVVGGKHFGIFGGGVCNAHDNAMFACKLAKLQRAIELRCGVDALDALEALNHWDVFCWVGVADVFRHLSACFLNIKVWTFEVQAHDSGVAPGDDFFAHFGSFVNHLLRRRAEGREYGCCSVLEVGGSCGDECVLFTFHKVASAAAVAVYLNAAGGDVSSLGIDGFGTLNQQAVAFHFNDFAVFEDY